MTTHFGKLEEFRPETETIVSYLERVDLFFAANDIADGKKVAVFLSTVGGKIYSLLRDLLAPAKPQDKNMAELTTALKNHFQPKSLVIAERFYFHRRNQLSTESIAEYMAELRKLAMHCEFRDYLNDTLRDRLVCGLVNQNIQKKLLSEDRLTLKKAVEIAQGMEAAEANMKKLQVSELVPVNSVQQTAKKSGKNDGGSRSRFFEQSKYQDRDNFSDKPCYRCGIAGHSHYKCRYREAVCRKCHKTGHLAKVCRSRQSQPASLKPVNAVADCLPEEETEFTLFSVGSKRNNPIIATLQVNGCPIDMEVDTGAAVSLVSTSIQKKYFPTKVIEAGDITLTTYTGEQIPVVGKIPVNVSYKEQNKHLYLYVVERDGPCLMGRDWLTEITLDWKRIGLLTSTVSSNVALNQLLDKYSEVFKEGSSTVKYSKRGQDL